MPIASRRIFLAVCAAAIVAVTAAASMRSRAVEEQARRDSLPSTRDVVFTVDCAATGHAISPLIYGVGGTGGRPWELGAAARRWGGNPTTRYNWQLNTFNLAKDWYFKNTEGGPGGYRAFLDENRQHGAPTALTVPMLGWVSKDASSYSFPVAGFGPQQAAAPDNPDMGNGVATDGKPIPPGPPTVTSVESTPETIAAWVRQIQQGDGAGGRSVQSYILDNEPSLWNSTHRDVHPDPTTYDELLEKTIAYATAVRKADPGGLIAGPAEWGWQGYNYSAQDVAVGLFRRPDRRQHGDEPLLPWYLKKIQEYETRTGTKLLDIVDVHYYPLADGIGIGADGKTDPTTSALRLRSTRGLWDPSYKDESWIATRLQVIPTLREWINTNHPGLGISIGEWNFGAETHMSGGLAVAEVLGHFGTEGITSAYYWTVPEDRSAAFWAFRAYRNFDGSGGRFLDWSVPVQGSATLAAAFASRDEAKQHMVAIVLNESALTPLKPEFAVQGCGAISKPRALVYAGGRDGFTPLELTASPERLKFTLPPYTISVLDFAIGREPGGVSGGGVER